MEKLSLKQVLAMNNIQINIEGNLLVGNLVNENLKTAIDETMKSDNDNSISVETTIKGEVFEFENTLHVDIEKEQYLLESRLFKKKKDQMIGAYLGVLDYYGNEIEAEHIDDIWTYANWEVVK